MLTDNLIDELLHTYGDRVHPEAMLDAVLNNVNRCSLCSELFSCSDDLLGHLIGRHENDLPSGGRRHIDEHDVEDGTEEIYICSFCGYAVGMEGYDSPLSRIWNHFDACPEYLKVALHEHKSWRWSTDSELICAYSSGHAEIEIFECHSCNHTFGTRDNLVNHIIHEESHAYLNNILHCDLDSIKRRVEQLLKSKEEERLPRAFEVESEPTAGPGRCPEIQPVNKTPVRKDGLARRPRATMSPDVLRRKTKPTSGPPILVGDLFSRTLSEEEVRRGHCDLPSRLKTCVGQATSVTVRFRSKEEENLRYDRNDGMLSGLASWYFGNAIEPGDKILLQVLEVSPPQISLWTEWQRTLDSILQCPQEDFEWETVPIRDCLIYVLGRSREPMHYRSLYAEISKHRHLVPTSVIGVLSRYRGILFEHTQRGTWELLRPGVHAAEQGGQNRVNRSRREFEERVKQDWLNTAVGDIKDYDLVYKLLRKYRNEMSFNQICKKLAEYYKANWKDLSATEFFNPSDPRLRRLTNGNFALTEWFEEKIEPSLATKHSVSAQSPKPVIAPEAPADEGDGPRTKGNGATQNIGQRLWSLLKVILAVIFRQRMHNRN